MNVGVGVSLVDDKERRTLVMVALLGLMASGLWREVTGQLAAAVAAAAAAMIEAGDAHLFCVLART